VFAFLLVAHVATAIGDPQGTLTLSLEAAALRAADQSPAVAAAAAAIRAPRALRAEARWPVPDNPSLDFGRVRRASGSSASYDRSWALTQDVEIGGQWLLRGDRADELVRSAEAVLMETRRRVALEARRSYVALAIAERKALLTDSAATFAERLAQFALRQFEAGEINRLELNATVLDAARARSTAERAMAEVGADQANLSRQLGLPPDSVPRTDSLPSVPAFDWGSDQLLVALARSRRPDLRAAAAARAGADRALSLARRSVVPNVMVSVFGGTESLTDRLQGVSVGFRVPLLYRQTAAIGAAEADRAGALAGETSTARSIDAEVVAAASRFRHGRRAALRFAADAVRAATENVTLTERALTEGEVSLTNVLVLRGTVVAGQLEYLDVLREAMEAWFELAAAVAAEPSEVPALVRAGA
jgi:cobalt-zinc-cadmium efflux system outer membrane protein